jgi:hypothetical protein
MKPEADQILGLSAFQLLGTLSPLLPDTYAQGTASLIAFMMMLSAQEYGRAADIRAKENADMRALFAALAPKLGDAHLKAKLEDAARSQDVSLEISALNAENYKLRRLLIALHEYVDEADDRTGSKEIWSLLKRMADRRVLKVPGH